jgi:alpha-mannosidase
MMDQVYQPFQLFFGTGSSGMKNGADLNIIDNINLPDNVQLMTFEKMTKTSFLVRFAHQFGINEDPTLSKSVEINLNSLLHQYTIKNVREVTLSANEEKSERAKSKIIWKSNNSRKLQEQVLGVSDEHGNKKSDCIFTINAMEILTFIIEI